jgi:hypothetical protein
MGLKAKYDAHEDRMLIELGTVDGAVRRFWATRRLWLSLYRMIVSLVPPTADEAPTAAPPVRGKPLQREEAQDAVMLENVKLGRNEKGMRLLFVAGEATAALDLHEQGLLRLKRMLEVQADRAGWDTSAALERLQAAALAGQAVRRAAS